ncbi:MAG: Trp biosynthesis-associated membrane protein [Candidatus Nanopelagicales bacterium]
MSLLKSMKASIVLLLVGGFGAIWLLSQPWVTATIYEPQMPTVETARTGATLYPVSFGAAWLVVACAIAFFAFGARVRRVLGVVLIFCGAAILIAPIAFYLSDAVASVQEGRQGSSNYQSVVVETYPFVWLMFLFGLAAALAGASILLWSKDWATLSAKQSNSRKPVEKSDWDALDAGEDPTVY